MANTKTAKKTTAKKSTTTTKVKSLFKVGQEVIYLGGGRSKKLRRGDKLKVRHILPNGTTIYLARVKDGFGTAVGAEMLKKAS